MRRFLFPILLVLAPSQATAWGPLGHRLVARLALDYLTDDARKQVSRLLGGTSIVDVAVWADSIRSQRRETDPWHFINIPTDARVEDWSLYCPSQGCIFTAIDRYSGILADRSRPDAERGEALRFLVHFIGDLHMPLHVGGRHDLGGNTVAVSWQERPTNLHAVWDAPLLSSASLREDEWLGRLRKSARRMKPKDIAKGGVLEWAAESLALARDYVYLMPTPPELTGSYALENLARAEDRIARAGIRLGFLLNNLLRA